VAEHVGEAKVIVGLVRSTQEPVELDGDRRIEPLVLLKRKRKVDVHWWRMLRAPVHDVRQGEGFDIGARYILAFEESEKGALVWCGKRRDGCGSQS
jgi:hypothetical protein